MTDFQKCLDLKHWRSFILAEPRGEGGGRVRQSQYTLYANTQRPEEYYRSGPAHKQGMFSMKQCFVNSKNLT